MKKHFLLLLVFLILIKPSLAVFCCRDPETYQNKCYNTGHCCNRIWYQMCVNFEVWSKDKEVTIGMPEPINVYIRNTGADKDQYALSYQIIKGQNVIIDAKGEDKIQASPKEIRVLRPKVILLSQPPEPIEIEFNVSSTSNKTLWRTTRVKITSGDSLYSMPDISVFMLLGLALFFALFDRKV